PADSAARRHRCERGVRLRAAGFGSELHADRNAGGPDCHGRILEHPDPALAQTADHALDRDCARRADGYFLRGTRHCPTSDPQPGDPEPAALVRRFPARDVYFRPPEDGRVRESHLAKDPGIHRCGLHRDSEHLPAGAGLRRLGRLMYKRILVPLENGPADAAILKHVRGLAKLLGAEVLLLHVADGWAARNMEQLNLRESQEMKEDRAYLERVSQELRQAGIEADAVLAAGDPAKE